jgi:hypothetical protein
VRLDEGDGRALRVDPPQDSVLPPPWRAVATSGQLCRQVLPIVAGTYSSFVNSASSVHPLLNTITAMAINRELLSSGSVAVRQILVLERMPSFECILIVHNIKISEREATA